MSAPSALRKSRDAFAMNMRFSYLIWRDFCRSNHVVRAQSALEFFRTKQRVEKIGAKQRRDDETDERLHHGTLPSKTRQAARIGGDDNKKGQAEAEIGEVEHLRSPF
jgi:hypothetical protein